MKNLTHTIYGLVGLSLVTTVLARTAPDSITLWVSLGFLILSGWKAQLILNGYLELNRSAFWKRGFNAFVGVFLIAIAALYLLPQLLR